MKKKENCKEYTNQIKDGVHDELDIGQKSFISGICGFGDEQLGEGTGFAISLIVNSVLNKYGVKSAWPRDFKKKANKK